MSAKIFHENLPKFSTREKECQKYGMNLVTIGSLEEQKNIMEQLKKYEREPAVYWISLDRKDKKSGWRWKYPGKFLKPLCQDGCFPPLGSSSSGFQIYELIKNFEKLQLETKQKTSSVSLTRILQPFGIGYVKP